MTSSSDVASLLPAPEVSHLEVGLLQNFVTFLWCPTTRAAAIVDPAWEGDRLRRWLEERELALRAILVTHTHEDHIEAVAELARRSEASVFVHPFEREKLRVEGAVDPARLRELEDGQDIPIGNCGVRALFTPGHTTGGTCYLGDGFVVTGDVLFVGGCGRTDFPGGNTADLWQSLQRLAGLPEETRVYPGHNYGRTETSSIGRELLENPYLRLPTYESFRQLRERRR